MPKVGFISISFPIPPPVVVFKAIGPHIPIVV